MTFDDLEDFEEELDAISNRLASRKCKDPGTKARTKRIEEKIGFSVPETHRADLHMAVMYCHEELEKRRDEQRFSGLDGSGASHFDNARAYAYRCREASDSNQHEFRYEREHYSEHRIIGVDTRDSGLRPDHAALRGGSIWLGFNAEDD